MALIDRSNRRTEDALTERRLELEALVTTLDSKGNDLEQRLTRFSSLLDQSLEGAAERAREIARLVAESTTAGARAIAENFEAIRTGAEEERKRATEAMHTIYEQATGDSQSMLTQAAERFADVVEGLKQHELPTCSASSKRPAPSCAAASSNCRRRPPKAPRRCAASSSTRSRRWPSSTASSPGTAAASTWPSPRRAGSRRLRPRRRAASCPTRRCSPMAARVPSRRGRRAPTSPA